MGRRKLLEFKYNVRCKRLMEKNKITTIDNVCIYTSTGTIDTILVPGNVMWRVGLLFKVSF